MTCRAKAKRLEPRGLHGTIATIVSDVVRPLPRCPFLPEPAPGEAMDWRVLNDLGADRGELYYVRSLTYGQHLWMRGLAARAILAVDRGLLADLRGDEPALRAHPLPYLALAWMIAHTPAGVFIGNPRVHYQHLADRLREPRRAQRSARAWACWHLARLVRPEFPGDPRHAVVEPDESDIVHQLHTSGIPGEADLWLAACERGRTFPQR